jgi:hypothetical protein
MDPDGTPARYVNRLCASGKVLTTLGATATTTQVSGGRADRVPRLDDPDDRCARRRARRPRTVAELPEEYTDASAVAPQRQDQ